MRFPRYLTVPGRLFVFSLLHQGKMVDGFFFNNGEGRSGWVGSVNINVCPNHKSFLVLRIPKKNPIKNKDINHYLFFIFQDYGPISFQLQPHPSPQPFWDAPLVGQVSRREMARDQRTVRCFKARASGSRAPGLRLHDTPIRQPRSESLCCVFVRLEQSE